MRPTQLNWAVALMLSLLVLLVGCRTADLPPDEGGSGTTSVGGQQNPGQGSGSGNGQGSNSPSGSGGAGEPSQEVPELPGNMADLRAAFGEPTPVTYTVVLAKAPRGTDMTKYLDRELDKRGYPASSEIVLVIFPENNHDVRFAMGALLFEKKISLQSMLETVRNQYLDKARSGDPAGGLADLIRTVNQLVQKADAGT